MKSLAEFIMRGRMQAALVALVGNMLPLVSPSAVGLVSLRRTLLDGLLLSVFALLPMLFIYYTGDINPIVILTSVVAVVMVPFAAEVLKVTIAWHQALFFSSVMSGVLALLITGYFSADMEITRQALIQVLASMQQEGKPTLAFTPDLFFLQGMVAYLIALQVILSLLLARWWQSLLYNPGGFGAEFHQLRMGATQAVFLIAAFGFCQFASMQYYSWSALLGLPLLFCGIALVHFVVAHRKLGGHWLVLFYIGLIIFGPLSLMLVILGFIDSVVNLRSRLTGKPVE